MSEMTRTLERQIPTHRECTRCDGTQHLVGADNGMGKYRCEECGLVVGFDLQSDEVEFLIDRGQPGRYTKDIFGTVLMGRERRMTRQLESS